MIELLRRIVALCLLRIGPQDLPYSVELTRSLVVLSVLVDLLFASLADLSLPLPRVALSLAVLLVVPWLLLGWRQRRPRYAQTLAALAGTGALFTLILLPLALIAQQSAAVSSADQLTGTQMLMAWLVLLLYGWTLMVRAHILRHAMDLSRFWGAIWSLAWFVAELSLGGWLFEAAQ